MSIDSESDKPLFVSFYICKNLSGVFVLIVSLCLLCLPQVVDYSTQTIVLVNTQFGHSN